jgi:hypothetical protein
MSKPGRALRGRRQHRGARNHDHRIGRTGGHDSRSSRGSRRVGRRGSGRTGCRIPCGSGWAAHLRRSDRSRCGHNGRLRSLRRLGIRRPRRLRRRNYHGRDRLGRRRRRDHRAWRQKRQWVDVAVSSIRGADAEVNVRRRPLRTAGLSGDTEHSSLGDRRTLAGRDLCEMGQGDGIAHCLNRHGPAGAGNGSGKRDDSGGRRPHRLTVHSGNVDPTVLRGRVRIRPERVGPKDVSPEWPCPAPAGRDCNESDENDETDRETTHCSTSCGYSKSSLPIWTTTETE